MERVWLNMQPVLPESTKCNFKFKDVEHIHGFKYGLTNWLHFNKTRKVAKDRGIRI